AAGGFLLVSSGAVAAVGGFVPLSGAFCWAMAGPAISAAPASEAMASERPRGANRWVMSVSSSGGGRLHPLRADWAVAPEERRGSASVPANLRRTQESEHGLVTSKAGGFPPLRQRVAGVFSGSRNPGS